MKRMKATFEDLSWDLVGEILCRLDSEMLSNCCSVCKTWHQIVSDPSFALLRCEFVLTKSKLFVVDRWQPYDTCSGTLAFSFTIYMDGWMKGGDVMVNSTTLQKDEVGSYLNRLKNDKVGFPYFNRLTCDMLLFYDSQTANLLSPRTGELHILPGYPYSPTCIDLHSISYTYGYDASKAEYILVAAELGYDQHVRVAKLSFTVGQPCSKWKIIWDNAVFPRETNICVGIILNNHVYWRSHKNQPCSKGKEIIVSMDLDYSDSSKAFCIIKSPPFIPEIGLHFEDYHIALIDYKGSLGMVDTKHMYTTNTLLLWLLKDPSSSSWTKRFHINLETILSTVYPKSKLPRYKTVGLKSSKEGELILCPDVYIRERGCCILNPETQTAEPLVFCVPPHHSAVAGSTPYMDGPAFL